MAEYLFIGGPYDGYRMDTTGLRHVNLVVGTPGGYLVHNGMTHLRTKMIEYEFSEIEFDGVKIGFYRDQSLKMRDCFLKLFDQYREPTPEEASERGCIRSPVR